MIKAALPCAQPLALAQTLIDDGHDVALLLSSLRTGYSGRYSYLAWGIEETITGDRLDILTPCTQETYALPRWFGYIRYEAVHGIEDIPRTRTSHVTQPIIRFHRFRHVVRFDHVSGEHQMQGIDALPHTSPFIMRAAPTLSAPHALMPYDEYIAHVEDALSQIRAGQYYQVNLTRKYIGTSEIPLPSNAALCLFARLCEASPAPYSALISYKGHHILSSSPELFLSIDPQRRITTRPIKGTAARHMQAEQLHHSRKDRAENLMIVDLMRHDIASSCQAGSVCVPRLWEVDSFSTLHHLSSTITGTLRPDKGIVDVLHDSFPPGSMTGAPKIAAMRWIAEHEGLQRGIYSGALGWMNGQTCELSVVIRTLIAQDRKYEFQVGGGIVADSNPDAEYRETLTKAQGLARAMGWDSARHTTITI
ncbi:MAG: anthranilate synthase component I family protein [Sphaerospermopsis sp. SIO1G2]|nr:anthranilate synthase component I family protein [Sphaerospermopsis sp. SIO1G2]